MGRRLALLIATYQYQDPGLRRLTAPAQDAEALAAVLQDPDIAGFEVTTLVNEPHHRVGEAIGDFYRDRRRDDLTLLYFTGHGLKDDDGRLYLAMVNSRRDSLLFTALSAEQIDQAMEGCVSRQKVLILDCCYSGAFPAGRLAKADTAVHALERFRGRGRTVLTASDATQYAFEGDRAHGEAAQSVFTRYLVAGLRDGSADLDGDGDITLDELYGYVYDRVVAEMPQQRPKKQDDVQGRTILARNINWSLPGYLSHAISSPIAADRLAALDGLDHLYRIGNDMVRDHVREEFRRLADDDSRLVSAAAAMRLQAVFPQPADTSMDAPQTPEPAADTSPPAVETAAEYTLEALMTPGATPPAAQAESAAAGSVSAAPAGVGSLTTESAVESPRQPSSVVSGPEAVGEPLSSPVAVGGPIRGAGEDQRWLSRPDRLAVTSGRVAALAGVLMIGGFLQGRPASASARGIWESMHWYLLGMAVVTGIAAVFILLPRTRLLIGPGLAVGAATASAWGLVSFGSEWMQTRRDEAQWLVPTGHAALVLAACLAGLAAYRGGGVRMALRRPHDVRSWVVLVVGGLCAGVSVLALAGVLYQVAQLAAIYEHVSGGEEVAHLARGYVVATAAAATVALYAAIASPRRFGLALLAGWAGGGVGVAVNSYLWFHGNSLTSTTPSIVLGCATLMLAVVAAGEMVRPAKPVDSAPLSPHRQGATGQPAASGHARRALRLAALAAVPLLAAAGAVVVDRVAQPSGDPASLSAIAVSPDGHYLYVIDDRSYLSVIDLAERDTVGYQIPVGSFAGDVVVSPDGSRVYVASDDGVSVIDTTTNERTGSPIPVGDYPEGMAISPEGARLYVANSESDTVSVIDTTTNTTVGDAIRVGERPADLAISPDGTRLYVANTNSSSVSVIDTTTNTTVGDPISFDDYPVGVAISQDGRRVYVVNGNQNSVSMFDTATNAIVGDPIPVSFPETVLVGTDGRLYVGSAFEYGISVIDTETSTLIRNPIPVGYPVDMATNPSGDRIYVAHSVGGAVWVIDTATSKAVGAPITITYDY